jgi:integrase
MPLYLTQRPGRPTWYIFGSHLGKPVRLSTKTDSRAEAEKVLAKYQHTEFENYFTGGPAATITFVAAANRYLAHGGDGTFMQKLVDHIGAVPLRQIDQDFVDNLAPTLYPKCSPATLHRRVYTPIIAVLNRAARSKLCPKPIIARPKDPPGRDRWLRHEEAERLIAAASPHMRGLVVFLFATGARLGEVLWLDWQHVDLAGGQVRFVHNPAEGFRTKTGKSRSVPLHPRVIEELAALKARHGGRGAVFRTHHGKPYARRKDYEGGQIHVAWNAMCERAGILNFHPHDCRHTWATWHYMKRRNLNELKELGGWASFEHLERYTHLDAGHLAAGLAEALAAWDAPPKLRVVG